MNLALLAMLMCLLIPIFKAWQSDDLWQKMLSFASIATKTSIMILVISVMRDDYMLGMVSVIILSTGDAGLMLLAHVIKRAREE
jgi:multicomponent Na+:H+ antiporter subunit F